MDLYKLKYTMLKTWTDLYFDNSLDESYYNIDVFNEIYTLPKMWQNILDNIIATYKYIIEPYTGISVHTHSEYYDYPACAHFVDYPECFEEENYGKILMDIMRFQQCRYINYSFANR